MELFQVGNAYVPASRLAALQLGDVLTGTVDPASLGLTLPAGVRWLKCAPPPVGGVFVLGATKPSAANTGIASLGLKRSDLTAVSASAFVPVTGATYRGLNFVGGRITPPAGVTNVTFIGCYFGGGSDNSSAQVMLTGATKWGWTFLQCTFKPDPQSNGQGYVECDNIDGHDYAVIRCDLSGGTDGLGVFNTYAKTDPLNVSMLGSYWHDFCFANNDPSHLSDATNPGWSHNDGMQIQGGSGVLVQGNNFQVYLDPITSIGYLTSPNQYAAISYRNWGCGVTVSPNVSPVYGITVTQNWFNGGGANFQMNSSQYSGGPSDIGEISLNRFGVDQYAYGGTSRYQIRFNQGLTFERLTTNVFDPNDPGCVAAGIAGNTFAEGKTTGIRINGID